MVWAQVCGVRRDGVGMHGVAYNATVLPLRTGFVRQDQAIFTAGTIAHRRVCAGRSSVL